VGWGGAAAHPPPLRITTRKFNQRRLHKRFDTIPKLRHDVLIEAPGWKSHKRLILPNTAAEFRLFADYLHGLKHPVRVVFEATGNYHRPLAHFLMAEGFHLELIASLAVARTREAMHNSWDKNDPKDAQVLLHLLKTGVTQHYHDPLANQIHDFQ
jgi:transposase